MLFLFFQISFPESYDPRTWPVGWVIVGIVAAFWLLKKLAETIGSLKSIREDGANIRDWLWGLIVGPHQQRKEMKQQIDKILKEVKPNGGDSIRDSVDRIELNLNTVKGDLGKVTDKVESSAAWIRHDKETSDKPIFTLDADGKMTSANAAFRRLVNAEESDLLEMNYTSRMEATDRLRFREELKLAIHDQTNVDTIVRWKRQGALFEPLRIQMTADKGSHSLKNFFCSAVFVADAPGEIHESQV